MKKFIVLALFALTFTRLANAQEPVKNTTGILGAFGAEVSLIHSLIQDAKELTIQNIKFTEGTLNGHHVVLAQTGMGKVNAAITTTLMLDHFAPSQVLFTGIAGGVDPDLSPGDLVIGSKLAYHDYGSITPDGMLRRATQSAVTQMPNPEYFPCSANLITLAQQVSSNIQFQNVGRAGRSPKVVTGVIVTGDVFVSSNTATQQLWANMHAEATEMEGAAVAQACWQQKVPFLVIRSLSDSASNNAHDDVAAFYQTAAHNSATLVMAIVGKIK
ncbi:adenosylhomocysteine nucleosidase [Mucilaginibacter gracilis]|uniref:adenosylhomocysteine nucleosidase n=1 Tax=Mucilaginibacter gracilis TaxID=423350 RepID=A0A495J450_9SPHI|nr:5'-methylthioadenosine/adenosylhomocysteine nucleosidase [Mucilaginibacter gracilis]RKR83756.1 adenosylhomocysteine nucleosidase [Mucilaginibacter gracilis]